MKSTTMNLDKVNEMYQDGATLREIGKAVGYSYEHVRNCIDAFLKNERRCSVCDGEKENKRWPGMCQKCRKARFNIYRNKYCKSSCECGKTKSINAKMCQSCTSILPPEMNDQQILTKLVNKGVSIQQIAKHFNVTWRSVGLKFKKLKIPYKRKGRFSSMPNNEAEKIIKEILC